MAKREAITDELRADIVEGNFRPGERLIELHLTERYSCDRLELRTALVELSSEGLVDCDVHSGAKVRDVSLSEAIQITEARAALEALLAGRAALNATPNQRAALESIGAEMAAALAAGDDGVYSVLDEALHGTIREAANHRVAAKLVRTLLNRGAQLRFRLAAVEGRAVESMIEHQAVIAAVVGGDAGAASAAMQSHLDSVVSILKSWPDED